MVDAILDHPDIAAVSFVGSSDIAQYIYSRGTANGKRVQAFGGAKNHGIVMPDADLDQVVNDLAGAAFGSAGERCMALPVVVPVGDDTADALREKLIPAIEGLRVGVSTDPDAHYGPVVSAAHKAADRALHPDGHRRRRRAGRRRPRLHAAGPRGGLLHRPDLVRPCEAEHARATRKRFSARCCRWSAPTISRRRCASRREHEYGNGVAIFTRNGHAAREFAARVNVGMVGINVPIPVPVAYHSFGGWKRSGFGDIGQYGQEGLRFWTKNKVVTQRWPDGGPHGENAFNIPTMA